MKIHPTAIISEKSKIDNSVEVGPFCIIDEDVEIKKGTKLLSHVVLMVRIIFFISSQQLEKILLIRNLKVKKLNLK